MNCETLEGMPSTAADAHAGWVKVTDFQAGRGWADGAQSGARARWCCEQLEAGEILYFGDIPFKFPEVDRQFLLQQRQGNTRLHKNVSYRPNQDILRGSVTDNRSDNERLHRIMRHYSAEVTQFLEKALQPYAAHWSLDFASFRPEEEQGRKLSLHKRNDLLHVDAFPSRPTRGGRILRCFTNINPTEPRIWLTTDRFAALAQQFAQAAGLAQFARRSGKGFWLNALKRSVGLPSAARSAYDKFMLRFHDYLKENRSFQEHCPKIRIAFPPLSTWMCFTDAVPHAVLAGQFAVEQTFIIPLRALTAPEKSPIRVLEQMAGRPLAPAPIPPSA